MSLNDTIWMNVNISNLLKWYKTCTCGKSLGRCFVVFHLLVFSLAQKTKSWLLWLKVVINTNNWVYTIISEKYKLDKWDNKNVLSVPQGNHCLLRLGIYAYIFTWFKNQ